MNAAAAMISHMFFINVVPLYNLSISIHLLRISTCTTFFIISRACSLVPPVQLRVSLSNTSRWALRSRFILI